MSKADGKAETLAIPDALRLQVAERDQGHCRFCGRYEENAAIHHVRFGGDVVGMGGRRQHYLENLLTVGWLYGHDCHSRLHDRKTYWMPYVLGALATPGATVLQLRRQAMAHSSRRPPVDPEVLGEIRSLRDVSGLTFREIGDRFGHSDEWARMLYHGQRGRGVTLVPWEDRFWKYVDRAADCWLWTGAITGSGYGVLQVEGRPVGAHRLALMLAGIVFDEGDVVDHLCRVTRCVRPSHLRVVDTRTNLLAGVGPVADNARKTHCLRGHPLSGANLYVWNGHRHCLTCKRLHQIKRG